MDVLRRLWRKLFPEKHDVVIVYPDKTFHYRMKYPKDGTFVDDRGNTYYLDRNKTAHLFIGGYANEVNRVKFVETAENFEFEPSETFKVAMESNIRRAIYRMGGMESWIQYVLIAGVFVAVSLSLLTYMDVLKIVEALSDVGVIK